MLSIYYIYRMDCIYKKYFSWNRAYGSPKGLQIATVGQKSLSGAVLMLSAFADVNKMEILPWLCPVLE